jgi:hypothetical protein
MAGWLTFGAEWTLELLQGSEMMYGKLFRKNSQILCGVTFL